MLLLLKESLTQDAIQTVLQRLESIGLRGVIGEQAGHGVLAITHGIDASVDIDALASWPEVAKVSAFTHAFTLASREFKQERSRITLKGGVTIGPDTLTVIAGPCSIESEQQIQQIAAVVAAAGATILRGGAFKPRTSPYGFQGLGESALQFMQRAGAAHQLLTVSEVMAIEDIDLLANYVDILQVGARNMQNFSLLKRLGRVGKPILLKRGMASTYSEFLMAAEYILSAGNDQVILCERGIRTFETHTRNTLDLAAIPILHELSHLPVIVDPSHGTGIRHAVAPMALAATAAGADGLMIEVHTDPDQSITDAKQAISPAAFSALMTRILHVRHALMA